MIRMSEAGLGTTAVAVAVPGSRSTWENGVHTGFVEDRGSRRAHQWVLARRMGGQRRGGVGPRRLLLGVGVLGLAVMCGETDWQDSRRRRRSHWFAIGSMRQAGPGTAAEAALVLGSRWSRDTGQRELRRGGREQPQVHVTVQASSAVAGVWPV